MENNNWPTLEQRIANVANETQTEIIPHIGY